MKQIDNINLLEIGIFSGQSLNAWNDYFKNSFLVGVDIDLSNLKIIPTKNMVILNGDATKSNIIDLLPNNIKYDYIIDDGSHKIIDILNTLRILHPLLKNDGYYFIEDIQDFDKDISLLNSLVDELKLKHDVVDLRDKKNRYDDVLYIVYH